MRVRGYEVTYPRVLLVALVGVVLVATLVGLSTSSTAFGSYNPAWEGTSEVREIAASSGGPMVIGQSTTVYSGQDPSQSTAVIFSPTAEYSPEAVERIETFLRAGGTVVLAEDFNQPANALLDDLAVESRFDGRLIRDERRHSRSPAFPVVRPVSNASLTADVSRLTFNHGTAITPGPNSTVLVNTSGYAYFDTNRNGELDDAETVRERPAVVQESVGDGTLVLVSDPSVFINAMLKEPDNRQFAENVAGSSETVIFDYSHRAGVPWAVAVVLTIADSAWLQYLVALLLVGAAGGLWWRQTLGLDWRESTATPPVGLSEEELSERLTTRHPEWDAARVERVAKGIMSDASKEGEND